MQEMQFKRKCPECGKEIFYISLDSFRHAKATSKCRYCCNVLRGKTSNRKGCHHTDDSKRSMSAAHTGKKLSYETRLKMSSFQKNRYSNPDEVKKMAIAVKQAMHRPDVRKRHIESLHRSKWLKVRTDNGQLELLNKWNRLGFEFHPNYQIKTNSDLFYIDGYDSKHNVVLEYDSKYHNILRQEQKDLVRQQKIINALHPKKFWRYNSETKTVRNILEAQQ